MTDLLDPAAHADDSWLWALLVLLLAVVVGAVLPVVPTGAAVSAMAALAHHRSWPALSEVLLVAAAAAYAGDLVLYRLLRTSRRGLGRVLHRRGGTGHAAGHVQDLARRLATHDVRTLATSRLLPGARVPVMLAAASVDYPLRRFAVANALPAVGWAVAYAAIGLAGRSVSSRPWVGVLAAVALGLLASGLVDLVRRRLHPRPDGDRRR